MSTEPTRKPPIAVFDLDGTLAETAGDLIGTLNVLMKREGLAELPLVGIPAMIGVQLQPLDQHFGFHARISTPAGSFTAAKIFMASTWAATS